VPRSHAPYSAPKLLLSNRVPAFEIEIDDLAHDARGIGRIADNFPVGSFAKANKFELQVLPRQNKFELQVLPRQNKFELQVLPRQNKVAFISGALPGELVRGEHLHHGKSFDHGVATEIVRASAERVVPKCAHFGGCAGCSLQHFSQAGQLQYKQAMLMGDLKKIGRSEPERALAPLFAAEFGYRRKARLSVKDVAKKGKVLVGFREPDGRFVADLARCETLHPKIGDRLFDLARLVETLTVRRHIAQIEVAIGQSSAALVFRNLVALEPADIAKLVAFGAQHDFQMWLQPKGNDSIYPINDASAGLHYTLDEFNVRLDYRPLDFTQVNFALNAKMVRQAVDLLDIKSGDQVLDLFCGLGNFTLPMARAGAQVMGVEGDAGLVARARENAKSNGLLAQVEYAVADLFALANEPTGKLFAVTNEPAGKAGQTDSAWANGSYSKILLDPPRAGAEAVISYLFGNPKRAASVKRLVYVSCNPATLARDTEALVHQHGFTLKAAGIMDMFTHTSHVESMALFERA
jgi:23S rRNA (uracil1939-C5)-methyltransferase